MGTGGRTSKKFGGGVLVVVVVVVAGVLLGTALSRRGRGTSRQLFPLRPRQCGAGPRRTRLSSHHRSAAQRGECE